MWCELAQWTVGSEKVRVKIRPLERTIDARLIRVQVGHAMSRDSRFRDALRRNVAMTGLPLHLHPKFFIALSEAEARVVQKDR